MDFGKIEEIKKLFNLPDRLMNEEEVADVKHCSIQRLRNDRHLRRGLPYLYVLWNFRSSRIW